MVWTWIRTQEKAKAKLDANKEHALKTVVFSQGLFIKMYDSLSSLANVTSDSICVYLKLFSVTDAKQRSLVRSKMSNICKPNIRQALQNIWHVQLTDAQVNGNIIDNIKPKTQGIQKGFIPTHTHRRNHEATFKP